ncbi:DUF6266 family protein [Pedobacter hartonius]|uniref:Uncharacterized protein n=1 Tax=Pedobacter hartonius TaxID=425514 RepID=A0A1H4FNX3_9SPHI|nr:DUF6266 family protein [Pedobacter hartonius]SEA99059.1 hypothetical protein SAMN05443550_10843 [Pedobacter hartonius]
MAHYRPGAAGEFNGRVGQTVMCRWRHLKIGRSRPRKTAKKPNVNQLKQRSRLGLISRFLSPFSKVVAVGFYSRRSKMTGMNTAVKSNIHLAVVGSYPELTIDESQVQLSKGSLDHVYDPYLLKKEDGMISVEWINPSRLKLGVEENDSVHLCFFSSALRRRQMKYLDCIAIRRDGRVDVTPDLSVFRGIVHGWMFLVSSDGKRVSDSKYLGHVEVGA